MTEEILPFPTRRSIEQAKELGARFLKTVSTTEIKFEIEEVQYVAFLGKSRFMIFQRLDNRRTAHDLKELLTA
jgi:hypothetical protein